MPFSGAFFHHQRIEIIFQTKIAIFIAETIDSSLLKAVGMREIAEIEAFFKQHVPVHRNFFLWRQFGKYPSVFPQNTVNIPYQTVRVTVKVIVVIVSALIRTEFLIGSSFQRISAIQAILDHRTKRGYIEKQKNYNRQQK